jgi:hypothetical protein
MIAPLYVYEPKVGGGAVSQPMRMAVYKAHGAQMNFGDLTSYLSYGIEVTFTSEIRLTLKFSTWSTQR